MEILIIFFLTLLNGFFSLSEIALVSVKKNRMEQLSNKGNSSARIVLELLEKPEHFLSAVQVGITLIGIISGAYGGATLTDDFEAIIGHLGIFGTYTHTVALVFVIGSITYFTIVIGELVPKTLALNNAEKIALVCSPIIKYFTILAFPFVRLLSFSTKIVLKLFGTKESNVDHVSEEELKFMLKNAQKSGVLEAEESAVHENIFYFSDQTARGLMTHISDVEWINSEDSTQQILQEILQSKHSKFVVCKGSIEDVKGMIRVKDFLESYQKDDFNLEEIIEQPMIIAQNMPAFKVLTLFRQKKQYLGVVMDEFGSFNGIITLHDLIEGIVGDLPEEEDDDEIKIMVKEDGSLLVDGRTTIVEFNRYFQREILDNNQQVYTTVAGFMLDQLQAYPHLGAQVKHENYLFEVVDIDGHRIDKIQVAKAEDILPE